MGFFDFLSEQKEKADRQADAREYLRLAREFVKEGERIYDESYNKTMNAVSDTRYKLEQHKSFKDSIVRDLGGSISATLNNFKNFSIDSKISAPNISSLNNSSFGLSGFNSVASSCFPNSISIPTIFSDIDYYEAKSQKEEARRYREQMRAEREKMRTYCSKLSEIRSFIDVEKRELQVLVDKLKSMTNELKSAMNKSSFTPEEAQYLKGIHKISESIVALLSTEFLTDSLDINQKYKQLFDGIKSINSSLPSAPSISSATTLSSVQNILDNVIVY